MRAMTFKKDVSCVSHPAARNNISPQYSKLSIKLRLLKLKFSKIKKKYKMWLITNKKLRRNRKNYLNMHL
jgi:hypothetical protein